VHGQVDGRVTPAHSPRRLRTRDVRTRRGTNGPQRPSGERRGTRCCVDGIAGNQNSQRRMAIGWRWTRRKKFSERIGNCDETEH
jgi:hypothetical protein